MIRLLADENFSGRILRGLLRHLGQADVARVQDVGLSGATDGVILSWAADHERILLTHDARTLVALAYERLDLGLPMAGVLEISRRVPIGVAVSELVLIAECSDTAEWQGQVRFLPL